MLFQEDINIFQRFHGMYPVKEKINQYTYSFLLKTFHFDLSDE